MAIWLLMLIFLAALKQIPENLYESAMIMQIGGKAYKGYIANAYTNNIFNLVLQTINGF